MIVVTASYMVKFERKEAIFAVEQNFNPQDARINMQLLELLYTCITMLVGGIHCTNHL